MFVLHTWPKHRHQTLLSFSVGPLFVSMHSHFECIRAVYHNIPELMFKNLNTQKVMQGEFARATAAPAVPMLPPMRAALEYFKDRMCAGTPFSLPVELLPLSLIRERGS